MSADWKHGLGVPLSTYAHDYTVFMDRPRSVLEGAPGVETVVALGQYNGVLVNTTSLQILTRPMAVRWTY